MDRLDEVEPPCSCRVRCGVVAPRPSWKVLGPKDRSAIPNFRQERLLFSSRRLGLDFCYARLCRLAKRLGLIRAASFVKRSSRVQSGLDQGNVL